MVYRTFPAEELACPKDLTCEVIGMCKDLKEGQCYRNPMELSGSGGNETGKEEKACAMQGIWYAQPLPFPAGIVGSQ